MSDDDDIRAVIDSTLAKSMQQHVAAARLRQEAEQERAAAAIWHERGRRAFWTCAAATIANVVVLALQLLIGVRL